MATPVYSTNLWQGTLYSFDYGIFIAFAEDPGYLIVVRDIDLAYDGAPGASLAAGPGGSIWPIQSPLLFDGSTWQWQGRYVIGGVNPLWLAVFGPADSEMSIQVSGFLLSLP